MSIKSFAPYFLISFSLLSHIFRALSKSASCLKHASYLFFKFSISLFLSFISFWNIPILSVNSFGFCVSCFSFNIFAFTVKILSFKSEIMFSISIFGELNRKFSSEILTSIPFSLGMTEISSSLTLTSLIFIIKFSVSCETCESYRILKCLKFKTKNKTKK